MIINTRCSHLAMAVDTLITAIGWIGFYFLLTEGIPKLHAGSLYATQTYLPSHLGSTLFTLFIYLIVAALNAVVLMLWVRYHKLFFVKLRRSEVISNLNDNAVASSFKLSCNLLGKLQDSRISVIHHDSSGDITRLEFDELLQSPSNCETFELLRAA